jgi:hypothetical protein
MGTGITGNWREDDFRRSKFVCILVIRRLCAITRRRSGTSDLERAGLRLIECEFVVDANSMVMRPQVLLTNWPPRPTLVRFNVVDRDPVNSGSRRSTDCPLRSLLGPLTDRPKTSWLDRLLDEKSISDMEDRRWSAKALRDTGRVTLEEIK